MQLKELKNSLERSEQKSITLQWPILGSWVLIFAFLQGDIVCSIQDEVAIPKGWILRDSRSTVDMFSNEKLLTKIRNFKWNLGLFCNAGKTLVKKKVSERIWRCMVLLGGHWCVLSSSNVQKKYKVMHDSTSDQGFVVHKVDDTIWIFRPSKIGLFFSDFRNDVTDVFVNKVDRDKSILMLYACILYKI